MYMYMYVYVYVHVSYKCIGSQTPASKPLQQEGPQGLKKPSESQALSGSYYDLGLLFCGCSYNPRGSKYPIFKDSGPKNHTLNSFWDQSP